MDGWMGCLPLHFASGFSPSAFLFVAMTKLKKAGPFGPAFSLISYGSPSAAAAANH
jgi:hypothetical protein